MRLKKLEVVGFKSFLEKTAFDFGADITGIVGPNGCGKSNVVDAIKWVTGELSFKELRGRSMQDLIFAGSELKPPTGMAEVALTLDNSDGTGPEMYREFSEITVLRRVFRDGTSEFFVNKTACRLRDVIDIFLDTGVGQSSYSIVEQGRVGMIVASKPEDRRALIEEAAGITKYKHRKKAAERKMEFTRQNLLRVGDILGELKRQIGSLERQARKAQKYREVSEEVRKLDLALSARDFLAFERGLSERSSSERRLSDDAESRQTELLAGESSLETRRLELTDLEKSLQSAQSALMEQSGGIAQLEKNLDGLRREAQQVRESAARERTRAEQLSTDRQRMEGEFGAVGSTLAALSGERESLTAELGSALDGESRRRVSLGAMEARGEEEKARLLEAVAKDAELRNQFTTDQEKLLEIDGRLEECRREAAAVEDEIGRMEAVYMQRQRDVGISVQLKFGFETEQKGSRLRLAELETGRETLERELGQAEQRLEGIRSRLKALEEFQRTYQGYGQGVRSVMERRHDENTPVGRVLGLLGEMIRPKRGYERAVEAVLQDRLKHLVVGDPRDALRAVEFLKSADQGRATFMPSVVRSEISRGDLPTDPGVLGWLAEFVDVTGDAGEVVASVLKNVAVVENLPRAVALWEEGAGISWVTPDGDSVSREGIVVGGSWGEEKGVLQIQAEIEDLRHELARGEHRREVSRRSISRMLREIAFLSSGLAHVEQALDRESKKAVAHEKDFGRLEEGLQRLRRTVLLVRDEETRWLKEKSDLRDEIERNAGALSEVSRLKSSIEAVLKAEQEEIALVRAELASDSEAITNLRVRQAALEERVESLAREEVNLRSQIESTSVEIERCRAEALIHDESAGKCDGEAGVLEMERLEAIRRFEERQRACSDLRTAFDELGRRISEEGSGIKTARDELTRVHGEWTTLKLKIQEERLKSDYLCAQVFERYAVRLTEWTSGDGFVALPDGESDGARTDLTALRDKLQKIGDVHLGAIEELKELDERFVFLTQQKEDLEKSLESLATAIRKINATTRERFLGTFESVNSKFEEIFPKLFRGGKARLFLTDPENLLETGVEIVAQPPGKRLQHMNLLSGGEKALTAISLIFAIFLHKAPPFCLLDEVDAPLDDQNVRRYLDLVEGMAGQTQFILITHNKLSMEIARNLYGITMEEPGVSRVVSVKIQQAEEQVLSRDRTEASSAASVA